MKKIATLALCICLLAAALPALGSEPTQVSPPISWTDNTAGHLPMRRHDNLVYHYSFSLPGEMVLEEAYGDAQGTADRVYDGRVWESIDDRWQFFFQLKRPTYQSLTEEAARLPEYLGLIADDMAASGARDLRFAHDRAIIHDLPAGPMLENAILYEMPGKEGRMESWCSVYLDYYDQHNEYIFGLQSPHMNYEEAIALLLRIGQTIHITPIRLMD